MKCKPPDVSLTMVGSGLDKDGIVQKIHDLDLDESIIMNDFVPNSTAKDGSRRKQIQI
ncbi:hypothetical protein [Methanosarcina sp. 2.H.A.1B.4]|uniref:hypothetical protein n=1 Tax=Methanosarcina sp. 2.H.A.1B.4 TaxID=1483600 RepID=UPI0012E0C0AE|nr:hypothetical protein [Methanosarcina sp. 2.H.A.1B.4]